MHEAIVIGRGPLGIYTSYKLLHKGIKVLNIDCGEGLNHLKNKQNLQSNITWKTYLQAPSLNKKASDFRWHGGCMCLPISELGNSNQKIPINEDEYKKSVKAVSDFFDITDFDFFQNKPATYIREGNYNNSEDIRYTYITKNLNFEKKVKEIEENDNYTFIDSSITTKITPGDLVEIETIQKNQKLIKYKTKSLYVCLGAVENARLLLNSKKQLKIENRNIGKNLNDHLRFPVANFKVKHFEQFRDLFDKDRNSLKNNNLWPRLIVENEELQSYGFFKLWRYDNVLFRKLNLGFLKKLIPTSGSCTLFLFVEKLYSNDSFLSIDSDEPLPNLDVKFFLTDDELTNIRNLANSYFKHFYEHYGEYIKDISPVVINKDKEFLDIVVSSNHPSGTTPMGVSPKDSVVNPESKLWTYDNIHIFGSSTLPRPYYIHPTFTSIVIADYSLNA